MNETASLVARIRALSRPLSPQPTDAVARIVLLEEIRAILFDIYGTLFISAAGDIGVGLAVDGDTAFHAALAAVGLPPRGDARLLVQAIESDHERSRLGGCEYPEVDIIAIWRRVLAELDLAAPAETLRRLALEYELRVNPIWPMPGLAALLKQLKRLRLALGLISNAQFYTPLLFPAFLERSLEELGFAPDLCVFSWRVGEGKPSRCLFDLAAARLRKDGVAPGQVLYVGNDLLKDIWPAQRVGFRTGLFAGDARSLRLRREDPRCRGVVPDCVFTDLEQILQALG